MVQTAVRSTAAPPPDRAARLFWSTFAATAVVKLVLAATFPFTGDEAYFVVWGRHLDYGYYDHGAMTGWWLWFMLRFGQSVFLMRLPAVIASQVIGWMYWRTLQPIDHDKGALAAVLYLISPLNVLNVLTTTDTPLLFFSALAVFGAFHAARRESLMRWFGAGLALGLAFLSKYFAVLLGVGFAVLLLFFSGRPRFGALLVLLLGVVPGVGINVAWNYEHCWINVLFNVLTRQEHSGISLLTPLTYLLFIGALLGPGIVWFLLRHRERAGRLRWLEAWSRLRRTQLHVFALCAVVPLAVFVPVSFVHEIGVHWLLSFVILVFPALVVCFEIDGLRRLVRPTLVYSLVPVVGLLVVPLIPLDWVRSSRSYFSIVLGMDPGAMLAALAPYRDDYRLATPSYTKSAMLGFFAHEHVPVIGPGSYHGREDDLITDMRRLAGTNVMIVTDDEKSIAGSPDWFTTSTLEVLDVRGARVVVLLGRGFRYDVYRERVLQTVVNKYYRMPDWLARIAAPCFFCERYDLHPVAPPD